MKPIKLGVLVSGSGTNLQSILDAVAAGRLRAEVAVVVSNRKDAGALARATAAGVATEVVDHRPFLDRATYDAAVLEVLRRHAVDYVVLAGFMRIVTATLLDAFPHRVVNIHPSLLPSFPGVDAPAQALRHGVRVTGCTVHLVDGGMDTGPILAQAVVPVLDGDTDASLRARVLEQEHALLPLVLQWIAEGRVQVLSGADGADGADGAAAGRPVVRVAGVTPVLGLAGHAGQAR